MPKSKVMAKFIYVIFIIYIMLSVSAVTGCGSNKQQQGEQMQATGQNQTEEKEAEKLKKLESKLEDLFEIIGGPGVKMEEPGSKKESDDNKQQETTQQQEGQQNSQQSSTQQGTQQGTQQQGEKQGSQQEDTKKQDTEKQSTQQQDTKKQNTERQSTQQAPDKWSEADKIINGMHYMWNDLMPDIAKKGANMKLVDNFDNALNNLTTAITEKNTRKALSGANSLYSHIPDLYSLYRTKMSPEAKRLIYFIRNIILESANDNWKQVANDNESIEKSWQLFRNTLDKEQQKIGDKLDFSIYELKKVSEENNGQLTDIKGKIALNNIKELQISFEEKK